MINKIYSDNNSYVATNNLSVFLAGPTPRRNEDKSWRPEACELFEKYFPQEKNLTLFVPERSNWFDGFDFVDQVEWEWKYLHEAKIVMFWIPRKLPHFPAFTTNVEFGRYVSLFPKKCIYGRPEWSEKNRYLDWLYQKETSKKPLESLDGLIQSVIAHLDLNS